MHEQVIIFGHNNMPRAGITEVHTKPHAQLHALLPLLLKIACTIINLLV